MYEYCYNDVLIFFSKYWTFFLTFYVKSAKNHKKRLSFWSVFLDHSIFSWLLMQKNIIIY